MMQYLYPQPPPRYPAYGSLSLDAGKTIPIYFIPGNHVYRTWNVPPVTGDLSRYDQYVNGTNDYSFVKGNVIGIALDSGADACVSYDNCASMLEGEAHTLRQLNCLELLLDEYQAFKIRLIGLAGGSIDDVVVTGS